MPVYSTGLPSRSTRNMRFSADALGNCQYGTLTISLLLLVTLNCTVPMKDPVRAASARTLTASGFVSGALLPWRAAKLRPVAATRAVASTMLRTALDMRDPGRKWMWWSALWRTPKHNQMCASSHVAPQGRRKSLISLGRIRAPDDSSAAEIAVAAVAGLVETGKR